MDDNEFTTRRQEQRRISYEFLMLATKGIIASYAGDQGVGA